MFKDASKKHVHNFQWVRENLHSTLSCFQQQEQRSLGTHNLTTTRRPTRDNFPEERYPARLRVHRPAANQVVDGKFDGLFWRNTLKKRVNCGYLSQ